MDMVWQKWLKDKWEGLIISVDTNDIIMSQSSKEEMFSLKV
jgi:hypothetical protein